MNNNFDIDALEYSEPILGKKKKKKENENKEIKVGEKDNKKMKMKQQKFKDGVTILGDRDVYKKAGEKYAKSVKKWQSANKYSKDNIVIPGKDLDLLDGIYQDS